MAFEQTQKTRVESKQFSGNWVQFAAPSGSTGNATEPYVEPSQGLDLSPLAKGIDGVVNTFENVNKQSGSRGGSGDGDTGEFINRAYDIVELNTDANGVLSAKGSEAIRNLRRQMARAGYTDSKIQSVLTNVGQDYKSTRQGLLQEESRKHDIEQEKLFAKKAVELHPELTGATLKEQADVGRRYYQKMNTLGATLRVAADTSAPKTVHDEALKSSADILITTINPTVLQNLFQQGTELSSQDELDATNEITKSIMSSGLVTDVREARSLAMEVSASFIGRARQYRTDMEKLTKDEQDRYLELMKNQVRMELQNSNPVLFTKLSLTNWDLTKWPEDKLGMLQNFDASKFGGGKTTRYWQGAFDSYTANVGVQQGDPTIADVSQRQILDEALKRGDVGSANESLQSLMNPNLDGVLNKPQMADQREEAVNAYKQKIAGAMVNELRPHVQPTTGFVPGQGRVIDVGFWDTSSKITPIMDKWKEGMRHIGMSDQEIVETGENALKALGVAMPDNTTNPEAFYQESARNIQQWMLQHPIKSKIPFADKATPASVRVSGAMGEYMRGAITKEEALAQMSAAMNEVNQDLAAEEYANEVEVEQEGADLSQLQQEAMATPEFKRAMEAIAKDESLDPQQKSDMAQNTLDRIVSFLQETVGIKSAQAKPAYADINTDIVSEEKTDEGYPIIRGDILPNFIKNVNKKATTKTVDAGGRSNEKLKNMLTNLIYEEARSEGKMGMYLVATAMWNRTKKRGENDKGDPSRLVDVMRKPNAFEPVKKNKSFYNKGNKTLIRKPTKPADKEAWEYCEQLAEAMINDNFNPAGNFTGFLNESIAKNKGSDFQREKEMNPDLEVYSFGNHLFYKQPSYRRYSGFRQTGT